MVRLSLAEIARDLGVSTATVSNVYNHPDRVTPALREKVLRRASALGYSGPNPAARQLRLGRTNVLGLVFTDALSFALADPASVGFLTGLAASVEGSGRSLLLVPAQGDGDAGAVQAPVDGFIVYSVADGDPHLRAVLERRLPTVVVDQPGPIDGADWIGMDDYAAARDVGSHLYSLGHRSIGVITTRLDITRRNGPVDDWSTAKFSVERNRLRGLADSGLMLVVDERCEVTVEAGSIGFSALRHAAPGITAVVGLADVLAIGALRAAKSQGLQVPTDMSIAGFDDIPDATQEGLTTLHQPLIEKGRGAGELLLRTLAGSPAGARRFLTTRLEVRTSTASPRHQEH